MSEIDQPTTNSNQQRDDDRKSTKVAIIVGCLLLALLLGVLYFVVSTVFSGGDEKDSSGTNPAGYVSGNPPPKQQSDPPSSTKPPTTTTTPRKLPPFTLICTVHFSLNTTEWLWPPEDNMCDFIYYESMHQRFCQIYQYFPDKFNPFPRKDVLVKLASTFYNKTRIGISVDLMAVPEFQKDFRSEDGKREIDYYNAAKIRDWGFLNLHQLHFRSYPQKIREAFITLKELAQYQALKKVESYMVVGLYLENETICDEVYDHLNTIFTPHGIISLGHTSIGCSYVVKNYQTIRTIPANIVDDPQKWFTDEPLKVNQNMAQAIRAVRCLQSKGVDTTFSMSMTVAPIYYEACGVEDGRIDGFFARCFKPFNRVEIEKFCSPSRMEEYETSDIYSSVYYTYKEDEIVLFDNLHYLQQKACESWRTANDIPLGVSIYDINYDYMNQNAPASTQPHFSCSNYSHWDGDGVRVNYLLKFRHFVASEYANPSSETDYPDGCANP